MFPKILCVVLLSHGLLAAQEPPATEPPASTEPSIATPVIDQAALSAAPAASPTTARILGDIPDGTPPPSAPPKPAFVAPAKDVLATTTHQQGGRTITIQRIKPIALPPPPDPEPAPVAMDPALRDRVAAYQAAHPRADLLCLGATVYRSKNSPPRTLVRYWPNGNSGAVTFWSSADFAILSGIRSFVDTQGQTHTILMILGNVDIDNTTELFAAHGHNYIAPDIPKLPVGQANFVIAGNAPSDESALVPVKSLHDLYNGEYQRLKTAYESRERANRQREADLKANPPKPKDIVLSYWRTDKPAPAKGGAK